MPLTASSSLVGNRPFARRADESSLRRGCRGQACVPIARCAPPAVALCNQPVGLSRVELRLLSPGPCHSTCNSVAPRLRVSRQVWAELRQPSIPLDGLTVALTCTLRRTLRLSCLHTTSRKMVGVLISSFMELSGPPCLDISCCGVTLALSDADAIGPNILNQVPELFPKVGCRPGRGATPCAPPAPAIHHAFVVHPDRNEWEGHLQQLNHRPQLCTKSSGVWVGTRPIESGDDVPLLVNQYAGPSSPPC